MKLTSDNLGIGFGTDCDNVARIDRLADSGIDPCIVDKVHEVIHLIDHEGGFQAKSVTSNVIDRRIRLAVPDDNIRRKRRQGIIIVGLRLQHRTNKAFLSHDIGRIDNPILSITGCLAWMDKDDGGLTIAYCFQRFSFALSRRTPDA